MQVKTVSLESVAVNKTGYPETFLPEAAFIGRSNVGKSSLINCMINRKSLAKTSQTPGKTRTINFYNVNSLLYFVDLPGYGYAKISKHESKKWGNMIQEYLLNREQLKTVLLLIDSRHAPSKNDIMMLDWLKYHSKNIIVIATKVDKLSKKQLNEQIININSILNETVIPFSSNTKQGKEELWSSIATACNLNN